MGTIYAIFKEYMEGEDFKEDLLQPLYSDKSEADSKANDLNKSHPFGVTFRVRKLDIR